MVTVTNTGTAVDVPVTVPNGTTVNGAAFGDSYAGTRSAWTSVGSTPMVLNQNVAPTILSAASATAIVGPPFSTTVVTTGAPMQRSAETGALPAGITFTDNGNGTATIAGTSTTGTGGSYPLTITATNPSGTATQAFTLTNSEAPSITSPSTATFNTGVAGTYTVTTTGYPAATITETGALPAGLTFTAADNGTATIAGTAAAGTAATYPVTISATNVSGSTATLALTLTVNAGGRASDHQRLDRFLHAEPGRRRRHHHHRLTDPDDHRDRDPPGRPDVHRQCQRHRPHPGHAHGNRHQHAIDHRRQRDQPERHPDLHDHRRPGTRLHQPRPGDLHRRDRLVVPR